MTGRPGGSPPERLRPDVLLGRAVNLRSSFPDGPEMPESEGSFQSFAENEGERQKDEGDRQYDGEADVLVKPDEVSFQGEEKSSEKPPDSADDEKLHHGEMPKPEDVAKIILGKAWDEEEKKDDEGALVVEKIVEAVHGRFGYETRYEGSTEGPRESESYTGPDGEADGREDGSQERAVNVPPEKSRDVAWNRGYDDLGGLKEDEACERPRT